MANGLTGARAFQSNLSGIGSSLGEFARQKLAREALAQQAQQELANQITLAKEKQRIEQEFATEDPLKAAQAQFLKQFFDQQDAGAGQQVSAKIPSSPGFSFQPLGLKEAPVGQPITEEPPQRALPKKTLGEVGRMPKTDKGGFRPESVSIGGFTFKRQVPEDEKLQAIDLRVDEAVKKAKALAEVKAGVPSAQAQKDLIGVKQQLANVDQMEKLAKDIPGGFGGIGSIVLSSVSRGKFSTKTRLYLKQLPAFAAGLYRDLTGDKRLSDDDAAKRAMPLLWNPTEDEVIKKDSFANIKKALLSRIKLIEEGKYQQSPDGDFITPLSSVLSNANVKPKAQSGVTSSGLKYTIEE